MHWEQIGFHYVDELLARSLFQSCTLKMVKMHDLVHDLARFVAGNECLIVDVVNGRYLSQNSRYASFICDEQPLSAALQLIRDAKKLRTFYLDDKIKLAKVKESSAQEVLRVISSNVNLLRALHLSRYPLKFLPNSFKKLKHLRYLDLSYTHLELFSPCISTLHNLQTLNLRCSQIKSIPDSIGNLHNLYTLDLSFTSIKSLPDSICNLSNLHTLDIHGCKNLTCMPRNIGKLNQLQILPLFISGEKTNCSLTELGSLKLEHKLHIKELQNVRNADEAKGAQLSDKHGINSLTLSWKLNCHKNSTEAHECDKDDNEDEFETDIVKILLAEDVLQSLQPNKSLRLLDIQGYVGRTFPSWMTESSLSNLVTLKLIECACEKLPALGQLPLLKGLSLRALPKIKHLGSDFYGGANAFPSLQYLELNCMKRLEEWCSAGGEQLLPSLHFLLLIDCPKLKAVPSDFSSINILVIDGYTRCLVRPSPQTQTFEVRSPN